MRKLEKPSPLKIVLKFAPLIAFALIMGADSAKAGASRHLQPVPAYENFQRIRFE